MLDALGPIVGVVIGAMLSWWINRSQEQRSLRHRWMERASEALADVDVLLTATHPHRFGMNMNREGASDDVRRLREQGEPARREVAVLAAGHPDPRVRETARKLETELFNSLHWLGWHVADLLRDADSNDSLRNAMAFHEEATRLAAEITDLIHH
jgi:hypothetical protein